LTDEQLADVACYVGGVFLDKSVLKPAQSVFDEFDKNKFTPELVGRADKITVNKDDVFIIGGGGKKQDVGQRIQDLTEQLKLEKTDMFRKKLERRIASLASGVGIIRVGALTEQEREYLRLKIEDAVYSSKAAMSEGTVKGGGLALKEVSEQLPDDDILKEAILAPYRQIQENAGGTLKIGDDIIDPLKVVRLSVENACSEAGIFLTTEGVVVFKRHTLEETLRDAIGFKP